MLPDMDGLDVCQQIWRRGSTIPILMLTTRGDAMGRVVGLEMGADDYLPKPFESRVLLARLRAVLQRGKGDPRSDVLRFGRLEIDRDALEIRLDGEIRSLTSHQFGLPLASAEHAGRVMSREALKDIMTAEPLEAFDRSIDVHISRIRAVIEDDAKKPRVITVRGARIRVCQGARMRRRRDRVVDGREAIHFCVNAPFLSAAVRELSRPDSGCAMRRLRLSPCPARASRSICCSIGPLQPISSCRKEISRADFSTR
jgi:two-component system, OmpR family, phosphate regulon response regulator OmpR